MPSSLLGALFIWWPPHRIQINRREVTQNILLIIIIIIILSSPVNSRKISIHNTISFIEISCLLYSDFLFRGFVLLSFSFSPQSLFDQVCLNYFSALVSLLSTQPSFHPSIFSCRKCRIISVSGWLDGCPCHPHPCPLPIIITEKRTEGRTMMSSSTVIHLWSVP